jgi:hypothetical protein
MLTAGELRRMLSEANATWQVQATLRDQDPIPRFGLGGTPEGLPLASDVPQLDFRQLFAELPTNNPFVLQRRLDLGLITPDDPFVKTVGLQTLETVGQYAAQISQAQDTLNEAIGNHIDSKQLDIHGVSSSALVQALHVHLAQLIEADVGGLDWRNRWGNNWITGIRTQDGCEACWAFAATALVEAMVRIEHCVWSVRSEGDVHKGMGAVCANTGGTEAALDWMRDHGGLADPDCFAWTVADIPYTPTPDRSGRSVRIGNHQLVGSIADQKTWLDTVGPLVTWFDVYDDFQGLGSGVYRRATDPSNHEEGGHFMLVIGYNDEQGYWRVKNSWGSAWGNNGYGRIAYGESGIDQYSKIGLRGTNPDPWTKRRLHSGNMIESGNGSLHRNFEMLGTAGGGGLRHWWREGSDFSWHQASTFANDAAVCPTLTSTTYNRNFESVHLTIGGRLHHYWMDQTNGNWNDGGVFGPTDAAGVPGFVQSNYGAPGNFEVVVRTSDGKLNHWWRQNGPPWTWSDGGRFGDNIAYSGPSLIQGSYGAKGNLELVAALNNGQMQHFWRDDDHGFVWHPGVTFGAGVASTPCMIQGQYGAADEGKIGNFELCVAVGGQVEHWWRNNAGDGLWRQSATFAHDVQAVAALVEGSFGFNLEVIVLRTDNQLQHYWRDGSGWHEGPVIGSA